MRRISALFLAGILSLALVAPALAASSSANSAESLNVLASVSITGVPATINYGDATTGQTVASPAMSIAVSTNNASGFAFTLTASALTSGGGTIAATSRKINCAMTGSISVFAGALCTGSDVAYPGGSNVGMGSTNVAGSASFATTAKVTVPAAQAAGAYTGTLTFTATTNP